MKIKRVLGIILCSVMILFSSILVFAGNNSEDLPVRTELNEEKRSEAEMVTINEKSISEPLADLQVITDEQEIEKIVSERPELKQYLEQNEPLAGLKIITDQKIVEEIWRENPSVKQLMEKSTEYKLAYVNNNEVKIRDTAALEAVVDEKLSTGDWVLLNQAYSVNDKFLWWEVTLSASGLEGWVVNDYSYLSVSLDEKLSEENMREIDFKTLKFVQ